MTMKWFLGFLGFVCSCSLYAAETETIKVYKKNPSFEVRLKANPTTGYTWSLVYFDKKLLHLTSSEYQAPKNHLMGAGGEMLYVFKVKKRSSYPGTTSLIFKYGRSWEQDAIEKKITVQLLP